MPKLALNNITAGFASTAALNANFDAIEAAIENTLSRDCTAPNYMSADFDMNGYRILNCADILTSGNIIAKGDWVAETCYTKGDIVNVDTQTYIAVDDYCASTVFADDSAHWQELFISFIYTTVAGCGGSGGLPALPDPASGDGSGWLLLTDGITVSWVQASTLGGSGTLATFSVYNLTATGGETTLTLPFAYTVGGQSLTVFLNGLAQYPSSEYTEDSITTVTFIDALSAGDKVRIIANVEVAQYVPTDATLASLYTLTPAANKFPYFTGATTAALSDLSAFVRTILGSADAAAFLTAIGGAAASTTSSLGVEQTWQPMSASRTPGVAYRNETGKPIEVYIKTSGSSGTFQVSSNNSTWISFGSSAEGRSIVMPNNYYYKVAYTGGAPTIDHWAELR